MFGDNSEVSLGGSQTSTSPELLGTFRTSENFPSLPLKFPGDFPALTVDFKSNPDLARKFPRPPEAQKSALFSGKPDTLVCVSVSFFFFWLYVYMLSHTIYKDKHLNIHICIFT